MTAVYFDDRWCAPHGIGRFAIEVRKRLRGFSDLPLNGSPTSPADSFRLAKCLRGRKAAGYFSPGFNVPIGARCPVITTIHDLIHVHYAGERSPAKSAYYRLVQRPVVRRSPVTLTVSEYSRRQIIQWYDVPESRVVCVGNGVSDEFKIDGEGFESEQDYFLYVGNTKPHKNVETLFRAMANPMVPSEMTLVMVCRENASLTERIGRYGLEDRVTTVSGVDDHKLATMYRSAIATVLPSHYEGFGLPLVESMSCGCPVIASDCTSIPEVLAGAGLLFDPNDHEQLASHLSRVLSDRSLREELRIKGLQRALDFSWDKVASRIESSIAPHLAR